MKFIRVFCTRAQSQVLINVNFITDVTDQGKDDRTGYNMLELNTEGNSHRIIGKLHHFEMFVEEVLTDDTRQVYPFDGH